MILILMYYLNWLSQINWKVSYTPYWVSITYANELPLIHNKGFHKGFGFT